MKSGSRSKAELQALIQKLDALCRGRGGELDPAEMPPDSLPMVLSRIRARTCLIPLDRIAEVLEPPRDPTRVPGTKPWFLGIANHRGTLLPIYDLAILLEGGLGHSGTDGTAEERPDGRRGARLLVIRQDDLPTGLLVSEVIGMRHVRADEAPVAAGGESWLGSARILDGEPVPVLDLDRLMDDPLFNAVLVRG